MHSFYFLLKYYLFLTMDFFRWFEDVYLQNTDHRLTFTDVSSKYLIQYFPIILNYIMRYHTYYSSFKITFLSSDNIEHTWQKTWVHLQKWINSARDQRRFLQNWKCQFLPLQQVIQKPPTPRSTSYEKQTRPPLK